MVFLMYFNGKYLVFYLDLQRRESGNDVSELLNGIDEVLCIKREDFGTMVNFSREIVVDMKIIVYLCKQQIQK